MPISPKSALFATLATAAALALPAHAQELEKVTFGTNWLAQADLCFSFHLSCLCAGCSGCYIPTYDSFMINVVAETCLVCVSSASSRSIYFCKNVRILCHLWQYIYIFIDFWWAFFSWKLREQIAFFEIFILVEILTFLFLWPLTIDYSYYWHDFDNLTNLTTVRCWWFICTVDDRMA